MPVLPIIVYKNAENQTTVVGCRDFSMFGFCVFFSLILRCFMFLFSLFQARIYGTKGGRAPWASVPILSSFLTPCGCVMRLNFGNLSVSLPTFYSKPRERLRGDIMNVWRGSERLPPGGSSRRRRVKENACSRALYELKLSRAPSVSHTLDTVSPAGSVTSGSDNHTRVVIHSPRFRYATSRREASLPSPTDANLPVSLQIRYHPLRMQILPL